MTDLNERLLDKADEELATQESLYEAEIKDSEKNKSAEILSTTTSTNESLDILKVQTENFNKLENIKQLWKWDWRLKQIENALQKLGSNKKNFYEIKENWNIEYYMDLVQDYLNLLKDKSWTELKSRNTAALIMAIQISLEYQWFEVGKIDGIYGNLTKNAILNFKKQMKFEWAKIMINSRPDSILIHGLLSGMEKIDSQKSKQEATQETPELQATDQQAPEQKIIENHQINGHQTTEGQSTEEETTKNKSFIEKFNSIPKWVKLSDYISLQQHIYWEYINWEFVLNDKFNYEHDNNTNMDYITVNWKRVFVQRTDDWMVFRTFERWKICGEKISKNWLIYKWELNEEWEYHGHGYIEQHTYKVSNKKIIIPTEKNNILLTWGIRENWKLKEVRNWGWFQEKRIRIEYSEWKAILTTPKWWKKIEVEENKLYTILDCISHLIWYTTYWFSAEWDNIIFNDKNTLINNSVAIYDIQKNLWVSAKDLSEFVMIHKKELPKAREEENEMKQKY